MDKIIGKLCIIFNKSDCYKMTGALKIIFFMKFQYFLVHYLVP